MVNRNIQDRDDVHRLVKVFYEAIKNDELLGPVFKFHIAENEWEDHIDKLTDFWLTNLFGVRAFKGNPSLKHINVDENLKNSISKVHFNHWLHLWNLTIDSLYHCERAKKAKYMAEKIAYAQHAVIIKHRKVSL